MIDGKRVARLHPQSWRSPKNPSRWLGMHGGNFQVSLHAYPCKIEAAYHSPNVSNAETLVACHCDLAKMKTT